MIKRMYIVHPFLIENREADTAFDSATERNRGIESAD